MAERKTGKRNLCDGCRVSCCGLNVPLTTYDIVRIMQNEGMKPGEFAIMLEDKDSPESFIALGRKVRFMMRKGRNGLCVNYDRKKGLGCTIEKSKPALCLSYPMELAGGKVLIRSDAVCPAGNRRGADLSKMSKKALEDANWESARYREMVADWNARGGGDAERFFRFALARMKENEGPLGPLKRAARRLFPQYL
jgi:Fe-S-cluster containining protein